MKKHTPCIFTALLPFCFCIPLALLRIAYQALHAPKCVSASMHVLTRILLSGAIFYLIGSTCAKALPSREPVSIVQVIDGDTVVVQRGTKREHLRLIGIDTPESRPNRRAERQSHDRGIDQRQIIQYGHQAANYTRSLLPKRSTVFIEYDVDNRDHYQRLLGYLWLPNGKMVNQEIVRAGYAYLLTVPPNVRYREQLAKAFSEARKNQRGLWSSKRPQ
jgi:micrococcal nuclease